MTEKTQRPRYSPEVRERAVRMVAEHVREYASQWACIVSIAAQVGCSAQALHNWVSQAERDSSARAGPTSEVLQRIKALERENRELRRANEILRKASAYFAQAEQGRRVIGARLVMIERRRREPDMARILEPPEIGPMRRAEHAVAVLPKRRPGRRGERDDAPAGTSDSSSKHQRLRIAIPAKTEANWASVQESRAKPLILRNGALRLRLNAPTPVGRF